MDVARETAHRRKRKRAGEENHHHTQGRGGGGEDADVVMLDDSSSDQGGDGGDDDVEVVSVSVSPASKRSKRSKTRGAETDAGAEADAEKEEEGIFSGAKAVLVGAESTQTRLVRQVFERHGGQVCPRYEKGLKYAICKAGVMEADVARAMALGGEFETRVPKRGLRVVSFEWVSESVRLGRRLSSQVHAYKFPKRQVYKDVVPKQSIKSFFAPKPKQKESEFEEMRFAYSTVTYGDTFVAMLPPDEVSSGLIRSIEGSPASGGSSSSSNPSAAAKVDKPPVRVASFDMDGTLIVPKSGRRFPKDRFDFKLLHPSVKTKLRELHEEGYLVVIFTNQRGVSLKRVKLGDILHKINDLSNRIVQVPFRSYLSLSKDRFRKPATGMWEAFVDSLDAPVDMEQSFYVGDAAGRSGDHACSDREFAANCGLPFFTPEEFFFGVQKQRTNMLDLAALAAPPSSPPPDSMHASHQEMVIFVGCPASGKTSLYRRYFEPHGYVHVNRDTLHSHSACERVALRALQRGQSVVIDNTNPRRDTRMRYASIAQNLNIPVRCIKISLPRGLPQHLNRVRARLNIRAELPPQAFSKYFKDRAEVDKDKEGFACVESVKWSPHWDSTPGLRDEFLRY